MRQSFVMEMVSGRKRTTASVSSSAKYTMILAGTFHWKIVIILRTVWDLILRTYLPSSTTSVMFCKSPNPEPRPIHIQSQAKKMVKLFQFYLICLSGETDYYLCYSLIVIQVTLSP